MIDFWLGVLFVSVAGTIYAYLSLRAEERQKVSPPRDR